jgi:hypothetical protein
VTSPRSSPSPGPALHLRRVVARHRPRLPRHHRHRLPGPARRPRLHARGRRLPARRGQQRHHVATDPGRRHRRLGRAAPLLAPRTRAGTSRSARPTCRAATPCAPRSTRRGHGDRRQAHHLPQDGRGHRRRRGAPLGRIAQDPPLRHQVPRLIGATTKAKDPVAMAHPTRTSRSLRHRVAAVLALAEMAARTARAGGRRAALHGCRDPLRRPRGDGPDARRRAGPAHPRHDPAGPADHGGRHGRADSSRPTWAGTRRRRPNRWPFIETCQKELLTAGLDLP